MQMCSHANVFTCICVHMHVCMWGGNTDVCICGGDNAHANVFTCMCVYVCGVMHMYVYLCVCVGNAHVCVYVCMCGGVMHMQMCSIMSGVCMCVGD